ncbi:MAG TPA: hypothetical protein VGK64_04320 [Bryobacteraceae bacterium]
MSDNRGLLQVSGEQRGELKVEIWFAKIERDVIARGVFTSVSDLRRKLMKYIPAYAEHARPIRWTYTDVKK